MFPAHPGLKPHAPDEAGRESGSGFEEGLMTTTGALFLTMVLLALAGCTSAVETSQPDRPASPARSGAAVPAVGARPVKPDPFEASPATSPYRLMRGIDVYDTDNGNRLVIFEPGWPRERTMYRVFTRDWTPRTPLLRVRVSLRLEDGAQSRFVGRATKSNLAGRMTLDEWVTVDGKGRIRVIAHQPGEASEARPLRRGDVHLGAEADAWPPYVPFAFREAADTVYQKELPAWDPQGLEWSLSSDETICVQAGGDSRPIYVSTDRGQSFTRLELAGVLPDPGIPIGECRATSERIVLTMGSHETGPSHVLTFDHSLRHLSTQELGEALDPWALDVLADGRLVAGTSRRGLMVAADNTNRTMVYRSAPDDSFYVVGDDIVVAHRNVFVSRDAGVTWRKIVMAPSPIERGVDRGAWRRLP